MRLLLKKKKLKVEMYLIVLFLVWLHFISMQTINESETNLALRSSSQTQKEDIEGTEKTETPVKQVRSPTTLTTVSESEHQDHDHGDQSSSINIKTMTMATTKVTIAANQATSEPFISTTAIPTTVVDPMISTRELGESAVPDSSPTGYTCINERPVMYLNSKQFLTVLQKNYFWVKFQSPIVNLIKNMYSAEKL